jgi:hypothetical protein
MDSFFKIQLDVHELGRLKVNDCRVYPDSPSNLRETTTARADKFWPKNVL